MSLATIQAPKDIKNKCWDVELDCLGRRLSPCLQESKCPEDVLMNFRVFQRWNAILRDPFHLFQINGNNVTIWCLEFSWSMLSDNGRYENSLRAYSHPLKVFEYFASVNKGKKKFMTVDDFIRSLMTSRQSFNESTKASQASYFH